MPVTACNTPLAPGGTRARLVEMLERAAPAPFTAVVAPPGSGKHTLIHRYTAATPHAWVVLGGGRDDPAEMRRALDCAVASPVATVVLDGVQHVSSPEGTLVLSTWLAQRPLAVRVIAVGDVVPASLSRRWNASRCAEIRGADLAFDHREVTTLMRGAGVHRLSARFVDALVELTGGWAAGLDAVARRMTTDPETDVRDMTADIRRVVEHRVMATLPDELAHFLRAAANHDDAATTAFGELTRARLRREARDRQLALGHDGDGRLHLHPCLAWALRTHEGTTPSVADAPSRVARRAYHLTRREADVLALMTSDLTMREIAATLFVSHDTIKSHTRNIYRKLNVRSRRDAVSAARAAHLFG